MDIIHVITPGDHFSARTGSAIPTVVHGLASAAAKDEEPVRHAVVVEESTMRPRYESASAIEYHGVPGPSRRDRYLDLARGRLGRPRRAVARYYAPIAEAIRQEAPSIVLTHNAPVVPWLLRDSPHRVVLYAHNELLRTYTRREAARTLAGVAGVVCVSESLAEQTRAALPDRLADLVHVVGNGVDTLQFAPAAGSRREHETSGAPLRIMFVGRMIPEKGADVLIRAAMILGRRDLEFVIVGSQGFDRSAALSPFERELRELAEAGPARVMFEPFVDRPALPALLRSADVLAVPSRWAEPSGLTAGEGLATGLPVIASRVGGIPEVLGPAGGYVEPDDPAALAAALADLADDATLRTRMGAEAREWALAHDWSWAWSNLRGVIQSL
ncbi:glycosyltransferase family 4 protein [Agromyces bauzanensis]